MTWKEDWICEGGHPYMMRDGVKYCPVCEAIASNGLRKIPRCPQNHTVPAGIKYCPTCERYRNSRWQKALDLTGQSTCVYGHTMTHDACYYGMRLGKWPERKCSICVKERMMGANKIYQEQRAKTREEKGLKKRPPKRKSLPPTFCDWVVALRLVEGKVDEVYDMRRDDTVGPTAMEKWVAYHSTPDNYVSTRTFNSGPSVVRYQWREYGDLKKWKPKTLAQAMREE